MMRVAVMQPYFLPYLGYFQLLAAVDRFVLLDDVNYITRGWIPRNRIWRLGKPSWLTIPLVGASQNRFIQDLEILPDDGWKEKMRRKVMDAYAGAPQFCAVMPVFSEIVADASGNLSWFLERTLSRVNEFIGIKTTLVTASALHPREGLKGQERILEICRREGASVYVNLPGGRALYDSAPFENAGVLLRFLGSPQADLRCSGDEGPVLSILDLLMLNPPDLVLAAIRNYQLLEP